MLLLFAILGIILLSVYGYQLKLIIESWIKDYGSQYYYEDDLASVSIIVAGKNEEEHIEKCLRQLTLLDYPKDKYEIIFVDDYSTDRTKEIAERIEFNRLTVLSNTGKTGKKSALAFAIAQAQYELLLFTDADSFPTKSWATSMVAYLFDNDLDVVTGPIQYLSDNSTLGDFQYFDAVNNMAFTQYGISTQSFYLANGANLLYKKSIYNELGGYKDHATLASGDDVFMVQQAAMSRYRIGYQRSHDAIVYTTSERSWSELMQQRKRWATKTSSYPQKGMKPFQFLVGAIPIYIFLMLLLGITLCYHFLFIAVVLFLIKHFIDRNYLHSLSKFFPEERKRSLSLLTSISYLLYIPFVGFHALFPSSYSWKGNNVK